MFIFEVRVVHVHCTFVIGTRTSVHSPIYRDVTL